MNYKISFKHNNNIITFQGDTIKSAIGDCIDWLYENGYKFKGDIHSAFTRKPVSMSEIKLKSDGYYLKQFRLFHKIKGIDRYIWVGGNIKPACEFIIKMLENFGIDPSTIKTEGFESKSKIKKFADLTDSEE